MRQKMAKDLKHGQRRMGLPRPNTVNANRSQKSIPDEKPAREGKQ